MAYVEEVSLSAAAADPVGVTPANVTQSPARPSAERVVNALSIDVEDYFQVGAFARMIDSREWDKFECRVERNVERILSLLDRHATRATFFTLGWIAERYPGLVRRIVDAGHEIASHGYAHRRATEQSPEVFFMDITRAKALLESISGQEVKGYRAPSFSINGTNPWALDCIRKAGHTYSSSIYPVRHDHYGMPEAPRFPFYSRPNLLEIPITTVRMWGRNFPAAGGGFFRLLPYGVSRWATQRVNAVDGQPAVFYFHPWEIDPGQPRVKGAPLRARFRHYLNLSRTEARLDRLLRDFAWDRVDTVFLQRGLAEATGRGTLGGGADAGLGLAA